LQVGQDFAIDGVQRRHWDKASKMIVTEG